MLRLRTTVTVSALVLAGAIGMSWWMSAWPRMQDRGIEAAVAARQREHAQAKKAPAHATPSHRHVEKHVAIKSAHAAPPSPPSPVYAPSPAYPIEALRNDRGGVVTLKISVNGQGDVTDVSVVHSSGDPALDASARKTLRQWRFQAPENHQPMTFNYPVTFRIGNMATP